MSWCRLWFALALLLAAPSLAAPAAPDCSTPRKAADSLFDWLRPDSHDPAKASACMEVPEGADGGALAVQLKQVLDARGLYVPIPSLPDDADFTDEDGAAVVVPLPDELPVLALVRGGDGRWRYARDTLEAVPELYGSTFSVVSLWLQQSLPEPFHQRIGPLYGWQYLYGTVLVLLAWLVALITRRLLRNRVRQVLKRAKLPLSDADYSKTNGPVVALVVCGLLYLCLPDLQLPIGLSAPLTRVVWVAMWLAGVLLVHRGISVGADVARGWAAQTESKLDDQAIPLLRQAAQVLVLVVGGLYVLDAMGFDVWKLAAGLGIGGLAFALAAQDTVANVFGSINIFLDRPFQIGDWIKVGDVEGVVEEVGFRSTRVRTFYNSVVTVPNSQLTNANVDNLGVRPRRRIKMTLGLTYDTPPDTLEAYAEGVRAILAAHPLVQRTYEVHVYNLGDSAVEILVYYHVVTEGWHEELVTRSQNLLEFMRLAQDMGVSFAFPSTSVYLESSPEHPLPRREERPLPQLRDVFDSFGPDGSRARPEGPAFGRSWSVKGRETGDRGSASDGG
ncbi:MAG: mechanosensitive ion channel family protein [Myxococcales bacterium]|nr:mechanosensitive ion channel family protein [Myxococcales bacterium]